MGRLEGRVAIVTGGASGIGAATVRRFGEEGASVVVADINDEGGEKVAADAGGVFQHCDVGSLSDLEAAVAAAVSRFGGLDVLSQNAVWSAGGYVHQIDPEGWDRSLRIMLTAIFYGMRAAIPAMLERGRGSIINTSSIEGLGGEIGAAPYSTAKAGILSLTRNVAIEYGRKNIRANAICPGVVNTPLYRGLQQANLRTPQEYADLHALGRLIEPEEIANLKLFLASDESSAITGAAIVIDGGLTANVGVVGFPPYSG
jgi:NAD(P)-dependent dehydrogenase (short-subunit alcohol dehydrogenase family)